MSDQFKLDLTNIKFPDVMGIREAAIYLEMSEMYVRTLLRKGPQGGLIGTKDADQVWTIKKADLDAFKARPTTRGTGVRSDGKAYVIKIKAADLPKVEAALKTFGIALAPRYNYTKKAKKVADGGVGTPVTTKIPNK